jgi:hypothetical protein
MSESLSVSQGFSAAVMGRLFSRPTVQRSPAVATTFNEAIVLVVKSLEAAHQR